VKSRGSQCNETLLVRAAVRPGKKLGLQSDVKKIHDPGVHRDHSTDLSSCSCLSQTCVLSVWSLCL